MSERVELTHKFKIPHLMLDGKCTECGLKTAMKEVDGELIRHYWTNERWKVNLNYSCNYLQTFPQMIRE